MALKDILQQLSAITGYNVADIAMRDYMVNVLVNPAAKEIYDTFELRNVNCEQVFKIPAGYQVISLPYYVGRVISARDIDFRANLSMVDMRVRYTDRYQPYPNHLAWLEKRKGSPIGYTEPKEDKLIFYVNTDIDKEITITIIGKSSTASRDREMIVINNGNTQYETTKVWYFPEIEVIRKSDYTLYDIFVKDTSGNEVSHIPNCLLTPYYTHIEVISQWAKTYFGQDRYVQVLFRKAFIPMVNDEDVFVAGEIYDSAIYWKSLEIYYTKRQGEDSVMLADAAYKKCIDLIDKIAQSQDDGKEVFVPFGINPVMRNYERNII
jgi:hypothetical protein